MIEYIFIVLYCIVGVFVSIGFTFFMEKGEESSSWLADIKMPEDFSYLLILGLISVLFIAMWPLLFITLFISFIGWAYSRVIYWLLARRETKGAETIVRNFWKIVDRRKG